MWILFVGPSDADDKGAQRFAEIYKKYHKLALKIANDELHDPHQAQDVVENVFVKILENKESFFARCKTEDHIKNYIALMVKHNARDLLRHCDFVVTQPIDDLCMVTLYDPKVKAEQTALVKCLVDNLSEEEKILVSLYAIYGETAAETAQDMHKSKSAVYKGWERIRKKAQIIADRLHVDAREYL